MKAISLSTVTNVADPRVRAKMMREAISLMRTKPELGFVLVSLVASFIDGLVKAPRGKTRDEYIDYLKANFPTLCAELGAEVFYSHIRCASVHEFAPRPPLALAPDVMLNGKYVEPLEVDGQPWTVLNADRIVADFLAHLDSKYPEA